MRAISAAKAVAPRQNYVSEDDVPKNDTVHIDDAVVKLRKLTTKYQKLLTVSLFKSEPYSIN